MTFEEALKAQLEATPQRSWRGRRVIKVLKMKPSARRERILARMEAHAAAAMGAAGVGAIDWSQVDWAKWFDIILKVLLAILPLLLV